MNDEEEYGGDPPCWAHLFDEETAGMENEPKGRAALSESAALHPGAGEIVELAALARAATAPGAAWTQQSEDLNVNLLVFASGQGVAEHINTEVDVLLVGIAGAGAVTIDGTRQILRAGQALLIPKGTNRGIRSVSDSFSYMTCHCRRGGLWPRTFLASESNRGWFSANLAEVTRGEVSGSTHPRIVVAEVTGRLLAWKRVLLKPTSPHPTR